MIKTIITDIEQLSVVSDEVDCKKDNKEVRQTVLDLKDTMREIGVKSLTAIQIGIDKRIVVLDFNGTLKSFVNPFLLKKKKSFELCLESCSSIPDKRFLIPRYTDIEIVFQTPMGEIKNNRLVGVAAKLFQHCMDHLDGILSMDIGLEVDEDFDSATDEEKEEIIKLYMDSLDARYKELDTQIEENEDLKKLKNNLEIRDKIVSGKMQFVEDKNAKDKNTQNDK